MLEGPLLPSLGIPIRGVTIVSPYKEVAAAVAEHSSSMVRKAASTNIFVRKNGNWKADTTDPESVAVINGNRQRVKAAVIGCGGAGRAVAAALKDAGVHVTLVNQSTNSAVLAVATVTGGRTADATPFVSQAMPSVFVRTVTEGALLYVFNPNSSPTMGSLTLRTERIQRPWFRAF